MSSSTEDVVDQAIAWHLHLEEASAAEWHDFTAWLDADPANAAAYDRIALDDALLGEAPGTFDRLPVPANDHDPWWKARWFAPLTGGAIAAALCAALLLPSIRQQDGHYVVSTPAGRTRGVTLDDGTRIEMNGGTTLTLDRGDPRSVSLDRGEAVFHVRHDAAHPFTLRSGDATIQDVGTIFNVARAGSRLDIGVAEGSVIYEPQHAAVHLTAGMQLRAQEAQGRVTVARLEKGDVGSWRDGRLVFQEEPLGIVAEAIGRATGVVVTVSPAIASTPFTGVVRLAGGPDRVIPQVARLSGASWSHDGTNWSLSAGTSSPQ